MTKLYSWFFFFLLMMPLRLIGSDNIPTNNENFALHAIIFILVIIILILLKLIFSLKKSNNCSFFENDLFFKNKKLSQLNKRLEKKIQIELEKNRRKDILIQQRSRLASIAEMIGNIAHQWRQPLNTITASVSSLYLRQQLGLHEDKDIEEVNNTVIKQATYLSKTIDDFKNFFIVDEKIKDNFFVSNAINKTVNITKASYDYNYISLVKNLDNNISYFGNETLLSQVVLNILSNTKDALVKNHIEKKLVYIDLFEKNEHIYITVKDNANGIDNRIKDKIFEPYFTTKEPSRGTGLGLFVSTQILKNNFKGVLYHENIEFDGFKGSCFTIKFPKI